MVFSHCFYCFRSIGGGLGHITRNLRPFWNIIANSGGSGLIGGVITCVQNKFTGSDSSILNTAVKSSIFGFSGAVLGNGASSLLKAISKVKSKNILDNLSLEEKLLIFSNAIETDPNYKPFLIQLSTIIGNILSNLVGNLNQ